MPPTVITPPWGAAGCALVVVPFVVVGAGLLPPEFGLAPELGGAFELALPDELAFPPPEALWPLGAALLFPPSAPDVPPVGAPGAPGVAPPLCAVGVPDGAPPPGVAAAEPLPGEVAYDW